MHTRVEVQRENCRLDRCALDSRQVQEYRKTNNSKFRTPNQNQLEITGAAPSAAALQEIQWEKTCFR